MPLVNYYLESDDDTYIYGDKMFKCEFCENSNTYLEPFIYKETRTRVVKLFKSKNLFVIYENNEIVEIIKVMTCWSDDYKRFKIKNNIAYSFDENYHGRPYVRNKVCDCDFNEFIADNNL
jgi:hypothetical protein